jgi:LysR family pca operon transcriptional activator
MKFDPRRLIDLQAIAREGTFGRAAQKLGVSQPALSLSIASLERALGVRLLERSRQGASLTEYGRLLLDRAHALDRLMENVVEDIRLRREGLEGVINVGVSPAGGALIPEAVTLFRMQAPDVGIRIVERPDDLLSKELELGQLDVSVSPAGLATDGPDIARHIIARDRFILILAPDNPRARLRNPSLQRFADACFVMPVEGSAMAKYIDAICSAANMAWPAHSIVCNSVSLIKTIVARSECVSIISDRLAHDEISSGRLRAVRLKEADMTRDVCLRYLRTNRRRPVVERFIECIRSVAAK